MGKSLRIQVGTSRNPRGGESLIYWRIWGTLLQLDPINTVQLQLFQVILFIQYIASQELSYSRLQ